MAPAGYSSTPLTKKLGITAGIKMAWLQAPPHYPALLGPLPEGVKLYTTAKKLQQADLIHYFTNSASKLHDTLPRLIACIKPNGMIWISWPKKSSKQPTDITEDTVRNTALPLGLVDVKVCAIDEVWSGLKLVIRRENR